MIRPELSAALARGALVVTPNKRLARELRARHDDAQRAAGRVAWEASRAMPWNAFVGDLWQQALDAGLDLPPHRLDAAQAAHLWRRVVADDLRPQPLLDAARAASLAAEAWEHVHAYGAGGASWRGFVASGPEVAAFVRWGAAFERATAGLAALDPARAPQALADVARGVPEVASLDVVVAGFVELAPQQRRLLEALSAAGARVSLVDGDDAGVPQRGRRYAAATPEDELTAALAWAQARARADPSARVGVVVHDLHARRATVRALAEDVLCPGLQWPGRVDAPRPYDLSAGTALADAGIVASALDLIALAHGPLDRQRAAALVRSRYLPGGEPQRWARAGAERGWLERGTRALTLQALAQGFARVDPALASRWRAAALQRMPARATPRDFVEAWRRWLDGLGWCEGTSLHPAEHAARGAWNELLAGFVRLTAIAPRLTADEALQALRDAAEAQSFEPEAPGARIRILGVLEAAGLAFDALWVVGLTAQAWPRAPEPNPLLPIDWQRERDVPRSTPARELAYARRLTASLGAAAPAVVFSHATSVDDHANLPSPLIAHLPPLAEAIERVTPSAHALFAGRPPLERVADHSAPAWADGAPLRGGASLIEAQSACPFQATGRFRLRADGWPDAYAGLRPTERGRFLHAAFAAFWREVSDREALDALDAAGLDAHLGAALAAGRAAVDAGLWDALPPVVAAVETVHVARVMRQWLALERERPPFRVEGTEVDVNLVLAGHPVALRIDRVDVLPDGRRAIIDYKSGRAVAADHWFGPRPQAPQLGLYAMAHEPGGAPVAALAYAQLKPGQVKAVGLADDAATWPGLPAPAALKRALVADWTEALVQLRTGIEALARAVHEGDARVLPRDAKACAICTLQPLCRIAALDEGEDFDDAEASDA